MDALTTPEESKFTPTETQAVEMNFTLIITMTTKTTKMMMMIKMMVQMEETTVEAVIVVVMTTKAILMITAEGEFHQSKKALLK